MKYLSIFFMFLSISVRAEELSCFDAITSKHILDVSVTDKGRYVTDINYFGHYTPDKDIKNMKFNKGSFVIKKGEQFLSLRGPMVVKNKRGIFFKAYMIVEKKAANFDQELILVCDEKESKAVESTEVFDRKRDSKIIEPAAYEGVKEDSKTTDK